MRWSHLVCVLTLVACDDPPKPPLVPRDGLVLHDAGRGFLAACTADTDCDSGHCAAMAGGKRCTRACSSTDPCPAFTGWSCSAQLCQCEGTGKQPGTCGVDGDCDGLADKEVKAETCNGEDDDCNGTIDDVAPGTSGAKLYYRDADGDKFGDLNKSKWLCAAEAGWVTDNGDCDDSRADVHPGLIEVCGDNVDHDCDGLKEDPDVCGLTPIVVSDVNDPMALSATLKTCGATSGIAKALDITELVAKQDKTAIKYTVRFAGSPALGPTCASYVLHLGTFDKAYEIAYVYRPAGATFCGALADFEVFQKGKKVATAATVAFNAADPGHVSFTIPKSEYFPSLSTPTYYLKACSNATSDAAKDLTDCTSDSCETPVHR